MESNTIDWDEVRTVLPLCSKAVLDEIKILVLESRLQKLRADLEQREQIIDGMRHEIDLLQEAVKNPQINYDGVRVA